MKDDPKTESTDTFDELRSQMYYQVDKHLADTEATADTLRRAERLAANSRNSFHKSPSPPPPAASRCSEVSVTTATSTSLTISSQSSQIAPKQPSFAKRVRNLLFCHCCMRKPATLYPEISTAVDEHKPHNYGSLTN